MQISQKAEWMGVDVMGGRGGASGVTISASQYKKIENSAQKNDAKYEGLRRGAKYYEYTGYDGKVTKGETGNKTGGTYRARYSDVVSGYSQKSNKELETERKRLKEQSDSSYQKMTRSAASRTGSLVSSFASADAKISAIDQIIRRRKRKK